MDAIRQWLNGSRNYEQGVKLYQQHGSSNALKSMFQACGNTSFNRTKLAEALEALAPEEAPLATSHPRPAPEPIKTKSEDSSPLLEELNQQWKPLYKDASFLHGQLQATPSADERRQMAFTILDNFDSMQTIWDKQDYLKEHGALPPDGSARVDPGQLSPLEQLKRLKNLATYISKHKNNPKRAADVAAWQSEKEEIERILNNE